MLPTRAAGVGFAVALLAGCLAASPASAESEISAGSWTAQAPLPTSSNVEGLDAISATEAWVAAAPLLGDGGALAHTTDAGRTWSVVDVPRQVNAVFFTDRRHGWAAGNAFFHTTDGGATWSQDNDYGTIYDLFFLDSLHGWAAGNGAVTYFTKDGGLTWHAVSTGGGSTMGT